MISRRFLNSRLSINTVSWISKKTFSALHPNCPYEKLLSREIRGTSHSKMYPFAGFDDTCDASAVLNILERASVFPTPIQTSAKDVRTKVRNEWGHCNFVHWNHVEFQNSFQHMETMVRSLGLPKPDEKKELDELHDWETKGEYLPLQ